MFGVSPLLLKSNDFYYRCSESRIILDNNLAQIIIILRFYLFNAPLSMLLSKKQLSKFS